MPEFATGAYHREVLRPHMTGSFTDLVKAATTSWAMIRNLDNSEINRTKFREWTAAQRAWQASNC